MSTSTGHRSPATMPRRNSPAASPSSLPLVITLNCINDFGMEHDSLSGVAAVELVPLSRLAEGKIESASAVLLQSLAYLPRAAQRRLRPYQLIILCLGFSDDAVDSALAADLRIQPVHVNVSSAEEIVDTVMALFLGVAPPDAHALLFGMARLDPAAVSWDETVSRLGFDRSASASSLGTRSLALNERSLF